MPDGDKGGGYFAQQGKLYKDTPCLCKGLKQSLNTGSAAWVLQGQPAPIVNNPNAGWGSIPNAKWVGPSSTDSGDFTYQVTFCLCNGFKNASLALKVLADNSATVKLNNNTIGTIPGPNGFANPPKSVSTSNQGFFQPGQNVLEVIVHNDSNVTGLDVGGVVQANGGRCQ